MDETLGRLEGCRGGEPEENIGTNVLEVLVGKRDKKMVTTAALSRTMTSTFPLKYFDSAIAFTWTFWWLAVLEERNLMYFPLPAVLLGAFGTRSDKRGC